MKPKNIAKIPGFRKAHLSFSDGRAYYHADKTYKYYGHEIAKGWHQYKMLDRGDGNPSFFIEGAWRPLSSLKEAFFG